MKPPVDGWDRDEREAIEPLEHELAAIRARHASDPSLDLLRAADAEALPPDLQARVSEHLAESEWSRALVDGAKDVDHSLDDVAAARLRARIAKSTNGRQAQSAIWRFWGPVLGAAATVAIFATVWMASRGAAPAPPAPAVPSQQSAAVRAVPPPFELPLRAPDVRLSAAALTFRGPSGTSSLADDLAPALDAFRAADYARTAELLEPLEHRYPTAVEPPFYRGISRLFLNDAAGAIADLERAGGLADDTFSSDVAWYRAVAEQRAGHVAAARARLAPLCGGSSAHAKDACDGITHMDGAR